MAVNSTLLVTFRGKDKNLASVAGTVGASFSRMGSIIKAGLAVGTAAISAFTVAIAGMTTKLAMMGSDAEETASLIDTSLGPAAAGFNDTLKEFASSANRSFFELQEGSSILVAMTRSMGANTEVASEMSSTFAIMAADLGSFFNKADSEVLNDFQSALAGSSETLTKYGVDVRETTLKQIALNRGMIESATDVLPRLMRAQLIQDEIQRQAISAMGDAERTSDSFSNSLKGLKANIKDTATEMGLKLLPFLTPLIQKFNEWVNVMIARLKPAFEFLLQLLDQFFGPMAQGKPIIERLLDTFNRFVQELGGGGVTLGLFNEKILQFRDWIRDKAIPGLIAFWKDTLVPFVRDSKKKIKELWNDVMIPFFKDMKKWILEEAIPAFNKFKDETLPDLLKRGREIFTELWVNVIEPFGGDMKAWIFGDLIPFLTEDIPEAWKDFQAVFEWLTTTGTPILEFFGKTLKFAMLPVMLPINLAFAAWKDGLEGVFGVLDDVTFMVFELIEAFGELLQLVPGLAGIGGGISGFGAAGQSSMTNNENQIFNFLTTIFTSNVNTAGETQSNLAFATGGI